MAAASRSRSKSVPSMCRRPTEATTFFTDKNGFAIYSTSREAREHNKETVSRSFVPHPAEARYVIVCDPHTFDAPRRPFDLPKQFCGEMEYYCEEDELTWKTRSEGLAIVAELNLKRLAGQADEKAMYYWWALAELGQPLEDLHGLLGVDPGEVGWYTIDTSIPIRLVVPTAVEVAKFVKGGAA